MSSSLDLPRTGKSIPIALALRACVRACEAVRARDVSAVAGGGLVQKPGRPAIRALGSRVGPASGWPLAGWPCWPGWPGWPGLAGWLVRGMVPPSQIQNPHPQSSLSAFRLVL